MLDYYCEIERFDQLVGQLLKLLDDSGLSDNTLLVVTSDHGTPFKEIFERYDRDFYKIDPHLFSPAEVTFVNTETDHRFTFGEVAPEVLERSFSG